MKNQESTCSQRDQADNYEAMPDEGIEGDGIETDDRDQKITQAVATVSAGIEIQQPQSVHSVDNQAPNTSESNLTARIWRWLKSSKKFIFE